LRECPQSARAAAAIPLPSVACGFGAAREAGKAQRPRNECREVSVATRRALNAAGGRVRRIQRTLRVALQHEAPHQRFTALNGELT